MHVLVTVASRHGSTKEIGKKIAEELSATGLNAEFADIQDVETLVGFDAVVLGSAVYMGSWMGSALKFIDQHQSALRDRPVWLFSSGPLGDEEPQPSNDKLNVDAILDQVRPRGHHIFVGKLDPGSLGFGERLITRMVGAPAGDFRDWDDVTGWATAIKHELQELLSRN